MKLMLAALMFSGLSAFADSETTCIYRAPSSEGGLSKVILNIVQDDYGYSRSATVDVLQPSGRVNRVSIPAHDLNNVRIETSPFAELSVSVHVNSPNGILDLEYLGNDFRNDTAWYLNMNHKPNVNDMFYVYERLGETEGIRHRVAPGANPVADFAAELNWHGRPSRLRSSKLVCSFQIL